MLQSPYNIPALSQNITRDFLFGKNFFERAIAATLRANNIRDERMESSEELGLLISFAGSPNGGNLQRKS